MTSAIPPDTTLSVESVTITDGIAEVALSDTVLALPDARRSLLAAQIVYTLKQAGRGARRVDHGSTRRATGFPKAIRTTLAVAVEDDPAASLEPVPFVHRRRRCTP